MKKLEITLIETPPDAPFACSIMVHEDGSYYATELEKGNLKKLFQKIIMTDQFEIINKEIIYE